MVGDHENPTGSCRPSAVGCFHCRHWCGEIREIENFASEDVASPLKNKSHRRSRIERDFFVDQVGSFLIGDHGKKHFLVGWIEGERVSVQCPQAGIFYPGQHSDILVQRFVEIDDVNGLIKVGVGDICPQCSDSRLSESCLIGRSGALHAVSISAGKRKRSRSSHCC